MIGLSKKGDLKRVLMVFIVLLLAFGIFAAVLSFAETAEEEKTRLEAELGQLEQELQQIEGGVWVNISNEYCGVSKILFNSWNCDNQTGYHTVKVLTPGVHNQRFNFSNQVADAHNFASLANISARTFVDDADTDFDKGQFNSTNRTGTGANANLTLANQSFTATGGTITTSGGYTIHTFTTSGTFTPNSAANVEVLVIGGGGGGGGQSGGGGGAGGFRYNSSFAVTAQAYTVTVGGGGAGGVNPGGNGANGSNSTFSTINAVRGGGGGAYGDPTGFAGASGGSGGGGGSSQTSGNSAGGAGNTPSTNPSQGNNGGDGNVPASDVYAAGGGGGAGTVGITPSAGSVGGNGGNGTNSSINGSAVTYAGGGGGAAYGGSAGSGTAGTGGTGGGGAGRKGGDGAGVAGTANTGGGGGGGSNGAGGNGGSGIVIIRYPNLIYLNTGNFTSQSFDANATVNWSYIKWSQEADDKGISNLYQSDLSDLINASTVLYMKFDNSTGESERQLNETHNVSAETNLVLYMKFNNETGESEVPLNETYNVSAQTNLVLYMKFNNETGESEAEINESNVNLVLLMHFNNDSATGENNSLFMSNATFGNGTGIGNGSCILASNQCPVYSGSKFGRYGLTFDGSNDVINVSNVNNISVNGVFTLEFWFFDSSYGGNQIILSGDGGVNGNQKFGIDTGNYFARVVQGGSSDNTITPPPVNSWHHAAFTRDSSNKIDLYSDGVRYNLFSGAAQAGDLVITNIGGHAGQAQFYNGRLDEVAVWNITLTSGKIAEHAGAKVVDYSNYSNNGTRVTGNPSDFGANFTAGKFGKGLVFDGVNDYVNVSDSDNWNLAKDSAISLWVKHKGPPVGIEVYATQYQTLNKNYWSFHNRAGTGLQFDLRDGGTYRVQLSGGPISDTDWHHVALARNGNNWNIYKDGVSVASATYASIIDFNASLWIGGNPLDYGFFNGTIDEFAFWNVSLSSDKIAEHAGAKVVDYSNYKNNGTRVNQSSPDFGRNFTAGKFGKGLLFDGVNDYINISTLGNYVTIEMWVNDSTVWKHIANVSGTVYTNGIVQNSNLPFVNRSGTILLGQNADGTFFPGTLDEVAIWNVSLSSDKIAEHAGAKVLDYSNYKNNGTRVNQSTPDFGRNFTAGKFGKGLLFDGLNDYVNVTTLFQWSTIEMWMYSNNEWSHVANVSGTTYKNGIQQDVNMSFNNRTGNIILGEKNSQYFSGTIDEAAVWNVSLSPDDIKRHYERGVLKLNLSYRTSADNITWTAWTGAPNNTLTSITGFSITDDSLVDVVEGVVVRNDYYEKNKEKAEFHNQILQTEPVALTELNNVITYIYKNFSVLNDDLSKAGVAQSGTAADSDSVALTGLRVRNSVSEPKSEVPSSSAQNLGISDVVVKNSEYNKLKENKEDYPTTSARNPLNLSVFRLKILDTLKSPSSKVIKYSSKSSALDLSLSNLENDFNNASGLSCVILNRMTENILSFGNLSGSAKWKSLVTKTLFSDLENAVNWPLESPLGLNAASNPSDFRNLSNSFFTFSSNRNLNSVSLISNDDVVLPLCYHTCIMQGCLDMLFCEGCYEACHDLLNGHSGFKHLKDLPNHDSCSFKSRSAAADFAVRNDVLVDFDSHETNNDKELFKGYDNEVGSKKVEDGDKDKNSTIPINEFEKICQTLDCNVIDYITAKKKIKDVKENDYVLSLDENSGKLQPAKVNALLDHGIKPIYELKTESDKSINTTAEHPYLAKLYNKELCNKYENTFWNRIDDENSINKNNEKKDDFEQNGYCTRWVEVSELREGMEIAVPNYQNNPSDLRYATSSSVVNTLTNDCFLKCGSLDQIAHLFIDNDRAKYSVSSGSEISLLASPRNDSYLGRGKGLIALFNLLNSSSNSEEGIPERSLILDLCSSTSLNKASGQCSLTGFEKIISFVTPMPIMPVNTTVASTTKSIYLNSGCNFLSFLYMPALTSLARSIASSSVSLDLETILLNSSKSSCSISRLIASSLATSDQFIHRNLSIFAFNSSGTVNDTFAIYASPLCLLNNSNSSSSFTLFSNALLNTSDQLISRCLSNLSLSSFGNDIVTIGIFDNLLVLISLHDYVKILENVQIFKSFGSDIVFDKIASIKALQPQHVYDLSIEGTRNFIANDIVAHNTARYFQYRADFNTTDAIYSPILNNVSINYSLISNLTIFDDTEKRVVIANELFNFTANFTDIGNNSINGTNINCTLSHNATGSYGSPIKMTFDPATKVYFYNTTFTNKTIAGFNVTCDGTATGFNLMRTIDAFNVSIARFSLFNGSITDFNSLIAFDNITNAVLEIPPYGKIVWINGTNFTGADLNKYVNISENLVGITSEQLHRTLNRSANITIYNVNLIVPTILRNNLTCPRTVCQVLSYNDANLTFNVTSFSNFSAANGTLNISINLNVTTAATSAPVEVSGHVNLSNGTNVSNNRIYIFLNNDIQNLTGNFTDTSNTDFTLGVRNSTNISGTGEGANLTLANQSFATGGTITYSGGYTIHTFTSNGTFNVSGSGDVEYLVVAGGGGGAKEGYDGGGGAGGMRTGTGFSVTAQAYTITVGSGGSGSTSPGGSGENSVFSSITAAGGGGGGGGGCGNGVAGGSGGGGGGASGVTCTGGAGNTPSTSPSQGNNGGNGFDQPGVGPGGGGGGAGAVGANGASSQGGNGGAGTASSISGSSVTYAGGGGGGLISGTAGTGGAGGGGAGSNSGAGIAGTANTGGGGGGAGGGVASSGGAGGSGIVIIRYNQTLTYLNTGNFTSRVFDAGSMTNWTYITWSNTTPVNTNLTLYYRTSADNINYSNWNQISNNTLSALSLNSINRYLQYLAAFNTSNTSLTPILNNVTINYSGTFTDSFGNYNYTFITPATSAIYTIKINSTYANATGSQNTTITVNSPPVINKNFTIPTYPIFNKNVTIVANVTDADNNIVYVNFTLTAPNGNIINLTNSSRVNDLHNASFNLTSYGTWKWNVTAIDTVGVAAYSSSTGIIILMQITENLNASAVTASSTIAVSGHINLSNGSNVSNNRIYSFINEADLNVTSGFSGGVGLNFTDTTLNDFTNGTSNFTNATVSPGNVTLANNTANTLTSYVTKGNFTSRVFDAGSVVNWTNISFATETQYQSDLEDLKNASVVLLMHFDNSSGENDSLFLNSAVNSSGGGQPNGTCELNLNRCPIVNNSAGKFGKAGLSFNATNQRINVTKSSALNLGATTDSYSGEAWFKTSTNYVGNSGGLISTNSGIAPYPFLFDIDANQLRIIIHDGTNIVNVGGSPNVNDNNWHHGAFVRDVNKDQLLLYVDGVQIASATDTTTTSVKNNEDICIGHEGLACLALTGIFNGSIDEIAIWNISLENTTIKQHALRGHVNLSLQARGCAQANCTDNPSFQGPNGTVSYFTNISTVYYLNATSFRYFQYIAYLSTNSTNLTPVLMEVNASYAGTLTDSFGNYNFTFTSPSTAATYTIKVNSTWDSIIPGESLASLFVKNPQTFNCAVAGCFIIQNASGSNLAVFDSLGNVNIFGTLTQNAEPTADTNDFTIQNSSGGLNLVITNPEGNMLLKNFLNQTGGSLSPTLKSFMIINKTNNIVAYANSTGGLFVTGNLTENVLFS